MFYRGLQNGGVGVHGRNPDASAAGIAGKNRRTPKERWGRVARDGIFRGGVTRFDVAKQTGSQIG